MSLKSFLEENPLLGWLWRVLRVPWRAGMKFLEIDGEQRAASFAYYAFFALFPLILLLVTMGSLFTDPVTLAAAIIENVGHYMPLNERDLQIVDVAIHGVTDSPGGLSLLATVGLLWSSTHFFHAMVRGVNRAWGTIEHPWWRVPVHSFVMLGLVGSALFIGVLTPIVINELERRAVQQNQAFGLAFSMAILLVPSVVLLYGLSLFYKFAPRRRTRFLEVLPSAFVVTILLQVCRRLFERYVYGLSNFNAIYGTFAIVMILLVWIYFSGVIIIYGGCLCAAQAEEFPRDDKPVAVDVPEDGGGEDEFP